MKTIAHSNTYITKAREILKTYFGFDCFRGFQEEVISHIATGQDALVLMPTGGGKSLCYQIPALLRPGVAIVVSPLIALMEDQVAALKLLGIRAAFYNSSLTSEEAKQVLYQFHQSELDLLYIAPERLLSSTFLERLKTCPVALFAIDEAHCISQWGADFRPEYAALGILKTSFPEVPLIALTATADKQTQKDIIAKLNFHPQLFTASFNRPNIYYQVLIKDQPFKQLVAFLQSQPEQSGIIYCGTRTGVEEVAMKLQQLEFRARAYHAGLTHRERREVHSLFRYDQIEIVVATLAFGMGIDKSNVRFVIHYDLPKNIEHYYQETGRAGRDNLPAQALLLYNPADSGRLHGLITSMEDEVQQRIEINKLTHMLAFADASQCRRHILLHYFNESMREPCNNCDICKNPPLRIEATEDAQKFLSCVYRLKQSYGLTYIIDVLRGSSAEKIQRSRHHLLSTFGIGKSQPASYWKQLAWQLIYQDYCYQDHNAYNVLRLSKKAMTVLTGQEQIFFNFRTQPKDKSPKKAQTTRGEKSELFELLRVLRRRLAEEEERPPFMIFSDATLQQMVEKKPQTPDELLEIIGVGQHKLNLYGAYFLKILRDYSHSEQMHSAH